MKHREAYSLFLLAFLLMFAALLVSGAPRLIAFSQTQEPQACERVLTAFLCGAPPAAAQTGEADAGGRAHGEQRMDAALVSAHMSAKEQHTPGADANGNVLGAVSYMRSVYQAFALGDGFA